MMNEQSRREFLRNLATVTGGIVFMPVVSACSSTSKQRLGDEALTEVSVDRIPRVRPEGWDPIVYNRRRGNAGAIPESYLPSINGPDGKDHHLGKHLPYQPEVDASKVPEGYIALMWGNSELGYLRHQQAVPGPANNYEGHWYHWIRIRKATEDEAIELESEYTSWPAARSDDTGSYAVAGGGDITANEGKNTIYLAALPADVVVGDTVRIHAHCLTHGEYVDFLTL